MTRQTIDTSNYFQAVAAVGVEKLPRTLRSSHEYLIKQTDHGKDWSKFGSDQAFTRLTKIIFKKLSEFLNSIKQKGMEGTGNKPKRKNPYADIWRECQFIERFLAFHDQILYKNTFGIYIDELQKAITENKIGKTSPVAKDIMAIQNAMVKQFNTMHNATHFVISPATIKRFKAIVTKWQNSHEDIDQEYVKSKKKSVGLNGLQELTPVEILPSKQFADMQFTTIGLKDRWKDFIGDPCPGFTAMVFGMPKMGKSYLCVDFASYLAKNHGKVLYVSKEEFMSPTLALKIKEKDAANENLDIAGSVPSDLSAYQFVFLDSVTSLKLTPDDLKRLQATYPTISFVYVFQVTKAGSARGTNEYMHNVDVVIEIPEKGKAIQFGRFNQGGEMDIFPTAA